MPLFLTLFIATTPLLIAQMQNPTADSPSSQNLTLPQLSALNPFRPKSTSRFFKLKLPELLAAQFEKGNFELDVEIFFARMFQKKEVDVVRVVENLLEITRRPFELAKDCPREDGLYFENTAARERYHELMKSERQSLSEDEARIAFEYLASQQHIPFHYPQEGCFARAHEMSELLELKGIASYKAFVIDSDNDLEVKSDWAASGKLTWTYHVAPTVTVQKKDGTKVEMAIDPSIMSEPVPVEEWRAKLTTAKCKQVEPMGVKATEGKGCVYYTTNRYFYKPSSAYEPPRSSWNPEDIDDTADALSLYLPIAQKYEAARARHEPKQ